MQGCVVFWIVTTSTLVGHKALERGVIWLSDCLLWFVWEQHLRIIPDNLCFTSHADELRNFNEPVCRVFCLCMKVQLTCIPNAGSVGAAGIMPSSPWSVPLKHHLSRAEVKLVCRSHGFKEKSPVYQNHTEVSISHTFLSLLTLPVCCCDPVQALFLLILWCKWRGIEGPVLVKEIRNQSRLPVAPPKNTLTQDMASNTPYTECPALLPVIKEPLTLVKLLFMVIKGTN